MELKTYLKRRQTLVNQALERALPKEPAVIHRAMRYSVLGEGKRIRPILALAACEAVGGRISDAIHAACALEMIHAYSLVHDDLPAMDDDDFRRGKPSCHKKFGEALGILTGDALLTYAFELLSRADHDPTVHLAVIREVSRAIGTGGMIGGQVADVRGMSIASVRGSTGSPRTVEAIESIHVRKTGALIAASVRVGALLGGAPPRAYRALCGYGEKIGLVFQLVDDLLDRDGLARLCGREKTRQRAEQLTESAIADIAALSRRAEPLAPLARFILTRTA